MFSPALDNNFYWAYISKEDLTCLWLIWSSQLHMYQENFHSAPSRPCRQKFGNIHLVEFQHRTTFLIYLLPKSLLLFSTIFAPKFVKKVYSFNLGFIKRTWHVGLCARYGNYKQKKAYLGSMSPFIIMVLYSSWIV